MLNGTHLHVLQVDLLHLQQVELPVQLVRLQLEVGDLVVLTVFNVEETCLLVTTITLE